MSDRDPRFTHGLAVYDTMTAGEFKDKLSPGLAALEQDFPFLVDAAMSYAIGDVWGRGAIDDRTRELAMIAALGVVGAGAAVQLRQHVGYALNLGATADELRELVYLTSVAAGFPRALNMAAHVGAVFKERGVGAAPPELPVDAGRRERGLEKMAALGHEDRIDIPEHPVLGPLARDFPFLVDAVVDYAMGEAWTRSALEPATRQIAAVAAFAALGDAWPQVRLHVGHARRLGVTPGVLAEIVNILTVAVGFPIALNAAAELREALVA